jgi:pimeloyl-ACP methyl ester carboxylesterase
LNRRLLLLLVALLVAVFVGYRGLRPPAPPSHFSFGRGPNVVIVHGLGSSSQQWLPVARLLARRYRVTLVDLPGHGMSPMPSPFSLDRAVAALDRALAETSGEPVILVGHSLGGLVAATEALERPDRVRGLVLVETALRTQIGEKEREGLVAELERNYDAMLRGSYRDMARDSAQGEMLYREVAKLDPVVVKPWIHLAWMADLSGQMRKLQPPLLAVLAPHSWTPQETWPQAAEALGYAEVPRVRPVRLEDCGHFIMLDRPAALAQLIDRFAQHPDGGPVASR